MKSIKFVKAVASGNDFIIIDGFKKRNTVYPPTPRLRRAGGIRYTDLAQRLCQRKLSVGADGLLLLEPSKKASFKMRIFNPDGSEVEMCGNGSRCAALYAKKAGISNNKMTIETRAGNLHAEVKADEVKIKMAPVKDLRMNFDLTIDNRSLKASSINTGVPHLVCFVQNLNKFNVSQTGKAIREHPEFQPQGTNADFVEVLDKGQIKVRTYERGVEAETLACGTGCVAAAIVTAYDMIDEPVGRHRVFVDTLSGETLAVYFRIEKGSIDEVYLEGKAKIAYQGQIQIG